MRATSIGHAGILIDTVGGSILCDPWFEPAFFGSWFPFPRNDRLSPVLLPEYPTRELERKLRSFGFTEFVHTHDGEETRLTAELMVAIHVETSITDGPGGDSALVVGDGTAVLVNQNDCRTSDLGALRAHGRVDLHWLQYSGAIWYPMVYDEPPERMRELVDAKVNSQLTRAMRYVEAIDSRAVVPSAGPPVFLDPDLFHLNMITGDELSIFPDQRIFLAQLAAAGRQGVLAVPGTEITVAGGDVTVVHPMPDAEVQAVFTGKAAYLAAYQADYLPSLATMHEQWHAPTPDLLITLRAWWEPLLAAAPTLCDSVGAVCVLHAGDLAVAIDFPKREVREWAGEEHEFRFTIQRDLVETVVAARAVDWSNALFLSCRFSAWRSGPFNEYLYNFFKSLSGERIRRAEAEAKRRLDPEQHGIAALEFRLGDYLVERTCPHRHADLTVFGEIDGGELVCTLHGWRFDLETGRCLTAQDRMLRVRRAPAAD
jgi:UDP-MurNAc hydroxylase